MFKELPKLSVLNAISLNIHSEDNVINVTFTDFLIELVIDCKRLKRFAFSIKSIKLPELVQIYETMGYFTRLRELRLRFEFINYCHPNDTGIDLTLNTLSDCKRLTYLSLDLNHIMLSECFFASIETHLPQLQTLKLMSGLEMSPIIEGWMQKLPKLKCFDLRTYEHIDANYGGLLAGDLMTESDEDDPEYDYYNDHNSDSDDSSE